MEENLKIFKNKLINDKSISTISKIIGVNNIFGIKTEFIFDRNSKENAFDSYLEMSYEIKNKSKFKNFFDFLK